jgi:DNA-binding MarR family transcriptional regulator
VRTSRDQRREFTTILGLTFQKGVYTLIFMATTLERAASEIRETCVCMSLREASRAVTQLYDEAISGAGVRATQFSVLVALAQAPRVPLSKLAEVLVMDRTTLTRNLAPLIRDRLVEEQPMADKRVRAYALTARGRNVFEQALPGWRQAQARITRAVRTEDLARLNRTLATMVSVTRPT